MERIQRLHFMNNSSIIAFVIMDFKGKFIDFSKNTVHIQVAFAS